MYVRKQHTAYTPSASSVMYRCMTQHRNWPKWAKIRKKSLTFEWNKFLLNYAKASIYRASMNIIQFHSVWSFYYSEFVMVLIQSITFHCENLFDLLLPSILNTFSCCYIFLCRFQHHFLFKFFFTKMHRRL